MERILVPPLNFAIVAPNVYRSGFPNKKNFGFLRKLGLKSVMYLSDDEYSQENIEFLKQQGITFFHFKVSGNKEPFVEMDQEEIARALMLLIDQKHHPILAHCNKGKHRVGCLVGCLRRIQDWSMAAIFDEYCRFSGNLRIQDQQFIEVFDQPILNNRPSWL